MVLIPMFSSCYNDSAIWEKFDEIEVRLDSLENQLSSQVEAMSALLEDGSTVSSCKKNEDGSYTVTLSNGTKFTVLPAGTSFSSLVTYVTVDGEKYWATYGPDGQQVVLKDGAGNAIPVSVNASVKVKDGIYYLIINGKEYATGYDAEDVVQVFSSCTPLEDASGNVYAVKFTFGAGMEVTVALDGYNGVIFKLSDANSSIISDYYIDYGTTQSFIMESDDVIDYIMQVPDGWRVKDVYDELTGETYIKVTAPVAETVELGAAVAEGDLKVVSVVEGGKASVSKMHLSTDPFKTYEVSKIKAVIKPYTGIQKFAYGMMLVDDFDKAQVVSKVNEIVTTTGAELPDGYNISESGIDLMYEDIFGEELNPEDEYIFWVIPVLYREEADKVEAGFYAEESMLRTLSLAPVSAKIEVSGITLLDAQVKVRVSGTLAMYGGVSLKEENVLAEVAYGINNESIKSVEVLEYNGSVTAFPSADASMDLDPATTYVVWVVPVDPDKTTYVASDVIYKEFTTPSITSGGTLTVTAGDFTTTASTLTSKVSCADAAMIYYAYVEDGDRYKNAENATRFNKLTESSTFTSVRGTSADALLKGVRPETTKWLYAVAVGHDGKYGEVLCKSGTTGSVSFNDLVVSISEQNVGSDEATFTVTSDGTATEFIYWCGLANDQFWTNANFCAGTEDGASQYLAANPDAPELLAVMKKNGAVAADGTIKVKDLSLGTEHMLVVLAKDASGKYSHAKAHRFTTSAADFGELVVEGTEEWNKARDFITNNITWHKDKFSRDREFASYGFSIKTPTNLTAYITCRGTLATNKEEIMLEVEEECSGMHDVGDYNATLTDEEEAKLVWYDDRGEPHNAASFFNVFETCVHGAPQYGYVTYFASTGHDESNCHTWEDGQCSNYAAALEKYAQRVSLDYWIDWVKNSSNAHYYYQGDPNHEYSRPLTDETKINALAQAWVDIYTPYFVGRKPIVYVNDGSAVEMSNPGGKGVDEETGEVIDKVIVMLVDASGNYYEPMYFDVPNYWR